MITWRLSSLTPPGGEILHGNMSTDDMQVSAIMQFIWIPANPTSGTTSQPQDSNSKIGRSRDDPRLKSLC